MNLFNLLCIDDRPTSLWDYTSSFGIVILVLVGGSLLCMGLNNVVCYYDKSKTDKKAKKKCKRGFIYLLISIISLVLFVLIVNGNADKFADACSDRRSPFLTVGNAFFNLFKTIGPIACIIKMIISVVKNHSSKKEVIKVIITYLIVAVLIFFTITLVDAFVGLSTGSSTGTDGPQWSQCWCS